MVEAFFEKNEPFCLVLLLNSTGYLSVYYDWPKQAKNKGIYLIKKETKPIPRDGTDSEVIYDHILVDTTVTSFTHADSQGDKTNKHPVSTVL